jgi:hypothetical protein
MGYSIAVFLYGTGWQYRVFYVEWEKSRMMAGGSQYKDEEFFVAQASMSQARAEAVLQ